jgi:protein-tyrosine sulfotransferase
MNLKENLRKYLDYVFNYDGLVIRANKSLVTEHALETAKRIRGADREPVIIIHGVTKRAGTNYAGELLGLHPCIYRYPNRIWEIPFLPLTGDILKIQKDFFLNYEQNTGKIGENDFLPIFGASFIAYLHFMVPEGKRMLLKMPGVQYLDYFYNVFPHENLLLVVRDGRDVVTSTIKTWPQLRFSDVCRRWDRSARMIFQLHKNLSKRDGYLLTRYEDAVREPEAFVEQCCSRFGLDASIYPFEKIESLPVIGSSTTRKEGITWMKRPKNFNPIGRWQQWSSWKKRVFKKIAGQSLLELGYCENLDW